MGSITIYDTLYIMNNRYIDRLRKLRWTINRYIEVYKGFDSCLKKELLERANVDLDFVSDEVVSCIHHTSRCYTRTQLVHFNKLYKQYKLSDKYSSPTAYANEY